MPFLDNLNWRYATKGFDASKKVGEDNKNKILEAIRLAPTSYGLQQFHVNIIVDPAVRAKLRKSAWDQSQITDSNFLLVFSVRTDLSKRAEDFTDVMAKVHSKDRGEFTRYVKMINGAIQKMSEEEVKSWAAKQTYIALGFAMAACAELQIDSCPMEGFDKDAFKKILNLPEYFYPQVVLAVGYRSPLDVLKPKVRFPKEELFS
ncbi:MAG: NAD(P)H-dependent oxidoreductase [Candidatus Vogelbacteria bacterium]|nr:NAD(P)H-dependent oxidoreductase [Candidatus Vogelbacteria bacterium]